MGLKLAAILDAWNKFLDRYERGQLITAEDGFVEFPELVRLGELLSGDGQDSNLRQLLEEATRLKRDLLSEEC